MEGGALMDRSVLGVALGHVRNAAAGLLVVEDPSGESLFAFAECVDVEDLLADLGVVPEVVPEGLSPAESLTAASDLLQGVGSVPLGVWVALQAVRARVGS